MQPTETIPLVRSTMFDCMVPAYQYAPCGARAVFEQESSIGGYRCERCFAILGSVAMPAACRDPLEGE